MENSDKVVLHYSDCMGRRIELSRPTLDEAIQEYKSRSDRSTFPFPEYSIDGGAFVSL